jgi:hypothetical protein
MAKEAAIPSKKEVVAVLAHIQTEAIKRNISPNKPRNPRELLEAIRCGMAIWALEVATDTEVMEWVERNRRGHLN